MPVELPFVDDLSFETLVLSASIPVVVDFWAPDSAGYCNKTAVLASAAKDYESMVAIYRVNVDEAVKPLEWADVHGLPRLVFAQSGEILERSTKILTMRALASLIERNLKP